MFGGILAKIRLVVLKLELKVYKLFILIIKKHVKQVSGEWVVNQNNSNLLSVDSTLELATDIYRASQITWPASVALKWDYG